MRAPAWWVRSVIFAFAVLLIDTFLLERFLIAGMPWPSFVQLAVRPAVFLVLVILVGAIAHAGWWTLQHYWRRSSRTR